MMGDALPDTDHMVRYIKGTHIDDGEVNGADFCLREDEEGVSGSCLEAFPTDKEGQLAEVRRLRRREWKRTGRLAELNVGTTRDFLREELPRLVFIELPLDATAQHEEDRSHCEIRNLPAYNTEQSLIAGEMIADCVQALHPALI